jgi:hypothetical protein
LSGHESPQAFPRADIARAGPADSGESMTIWMSIVVAALVFASGVAGLYLQKLLPAPHTSDRSRDMISAIVGLVSLLLALVLGTLIGSAFSFYATQKSERVRRMLWWGGEPGAMPPDLTVAEPLKILRKTDEDVASLDPKTPAQRQFAANAAAAASAMEQTRLLISLQLASPVSWPLVVIVVSWALILFCGFGVLSRINPTTVVALGFGAFAVGSALFLILELTQPFTGVFRVPSGAFDEMLASLGT